MSIKDKRATLRVMKNLELEIVDGGFVLYDKDNHKIIIDASAILSDGQFNITNSMHNGTSIGRVFHIIE